MLKGSPAFSGFSVNDLDAAEAFYTSVLGLEVIKDAMGLHIKLAGGNEIFVYQKENHQPATFTILNFPVENIDEAADRLIERGVVFEHYENMPGEQDEKGIMRSPDPAQYGPSIAWFKDPAGNILSILQN